MQLVYNLSDPEMHQVKKGNEWHFGMKMHIGVDESLGLIHKTERTLSPIIVNGLLPCGPASVGSLRQNTLKKRNTLRPVCAPRLSMRSSTSNACSDIARFAIVVWRRTPTDFMCSLVWRVIQSIPRTAPITVD